MSITPVPGSGKFANRGFTKDQMFKALNGLVEVYTIDRAELPEVDPLTYEIIRHRIWATTSLMGEALQRMSGSLVVTDANDFNVVITDPLGNPVQVGPYNSGLVAAIGLGIQWILVNRSEAPGIDQGDMFLCNDPWVGAGSHQNDVALFAPIFIDGKLFAWAAAVAHQVDLGGVAPGSWTPVAEDVFWESLPTPPIKIVRDGKILVDVEDVYLRRSRIPQLVGLDLRAKMGANLLGRERLEALTAKYTPEVVQAVMQRQMDDAEYQLRKKLESCPDGVWTGSSYQEQCKTGDRGLHAVRCTMTKSGDGLTMDFRRTDPQAGMINCTYAGLYGGIISALMPVLCGDIPWSTGGLMRCVTIISEPGTLNDAVFPSAVGKGSVASAWATTNCVFECLGKMLNSSASTKKNTFSGCCGTWDLCALAGLDQRGDPFATMLMDPMGSGFGAGVDLDGVDTGGISILSMGKMPDVEMNEFVIPVLYLWRREETNSGGPGMFRGGLSASLAVVPHDTAVPIAQVISGSGKAIPMNFGLAGGYPGNTQRDVTIANSNIHELFSQGLMPETLEAIEGKTIIQGCEEVTQLNPGDVYFMHWQGGGGYGDPLLRDPENVLRDIQQFKVSIDVARDIYGTIIVDNEVEKAGTEKRREQIRQTRKSQLLESELVKTETLGHMHPLEDSVKHSLVELSTDGKSYWACHNCGEQISESEEGIPGNLKTFTADVSFSGPQIETNPRLYVDSDSQFQQTCCPNCWTALDTRVTPVLMS
ncbi:MAG: N-methylhydantoinase B [Rhodothermales bacterium]|jgi:N-methylhydantoinase B